MCVVTNARHVGQRGDAVEVALHARPRGEVDAEVGRPGADDVGVRVRDREGVAHQELLAVLGEHELVQRLELRLRARLAERAHLLAQRRREQRPHGRVQLRGDPVERVLHLVARRGARLGQQAARLLRNRRRTERDKTERRRQLRRVQCARAARDRTGKRARGRDLTTQQTTRGRQEAAGARRRQRQLLQRQLPC